MIKIPAKVLIVDDEKDFVEIFALRLQEAGEKIFTAYSGKECLEKLASENIDVIILDIKMPDMDGIETLKKIKALYPLVEVIMLTGHATAETAVIGMKMGAFDYIMKPADFNAIQTMVKDARIKKDEHEEKIRQMEVKLLLRKGGNM